MKEIPNITNKPELMLVGKTLLINLTKIKKINDEEITFMNKEKLYIPKIGIFLYLRLQNKLCD